MKTTRLPKVPLRLFSYRKSPEPGRFRRLPLQAAVSNYRSGLFCDPDKNSPSALLSVASKNGSRYKFPHDPKLLCFGMVFCVLLLINFRELFSPPYWDEITGLHNQALYLAEHHFDLSGLFVREQGYLCGGSAIYRDELTPFLYAVFYRFPPHTAHLLGHLFSIGCIAGCATLLFSLLNGFCSLPVAGLWTVAFLADPIIAGRAAAMDHDTVLAFAVMAALTAFYRKQDKTAISLTVLAVLTKFTGILLLPALDAFYFWNAVRRRKSRDWGYAVFCGLLFAGLFFLHWYCGARIDGPPESGKFWSFSPDELLFQLKYYYPWLAGAAAVVFGGFIRAFLTDPEFRNEEERLWPAALFIAGYFCAYFIAPYPKLPRYSCIVIAPLVFLAAASIRPCREKRLKTGLTVWCLISLLNWYGYLLPDFRARMQQTPQFFERSREYLALVERDRALCRELEPAGSRLIVVKWPYAQMLGVPAYGYVAHALPQLRVIGNNVAHALTVRQFDPAEVTRETLFCYSPRGFEFYHYPRLAPPDGARLHYVEDPASPLDGALVYSNIHVRKGGKR